MAGAVQQVSIIGTGVIGASWATAFLARGLDVTASDPAPHAETVLRQTIDAQWHAMEQIGLSPGASPQRLRFVESPEAAVSEADFVQENGPERIDIKRDLFHRLDEAAPTDALIATSSSTITVSEFQDACTHHPERVLLGHPFNPPHLVPLVEVSGGRTTSEEAIERALSFYREIGKHPIRLRKESRGHVANRLQAALWQEAFHLVATGVASVADIDAAIAHGPGLRWALLGPFLNLHLSGGPGGIGDLFAKPLWEATERIWRDLGTASVDRALAGQVASGIAAEIGTDDQDSVIRERDALLVELLRLK